MWSTSGGPLAISDRGGLSTRTLKLRRGAGRPRSAGALASPPDCVSGLRGWGLEFGV